ncbi:MAG: hypothetical protein WCY65_01825 [Candidatus Methanomethylophilaceae archaeon]
MTQEEHYRPAAVAFEVRGRLEPPMPPEKATQLFNDIIGDVTRACVQAGSWMVGHVKAAVEGGAGFLSISSTTDDGKVRNRESLSGDLQDYNFSANVIVYGISEEQVTDIFLRRLKTSLPDALVQVIREEGCDDPECHDPACRDPGHRRIIPLS